MKKLLFVILLLPSMALAQADMNEARPEIRDLLGDERGRFYTNVEIDSAWNRAQRLVGLWAGILVPQRDSLTTSANTSFYALNADFFRMRAVYKGLGQNQTIVPLIDDFDSYRLAGRELPSEYASVHGTNLFLYPMPTSAQRVYYLWYRNPALAATAAADTEIPRLLHSAPVWEAASQLVLKSQNVTLSQTYHNRAREIVDWYRQLITQQGSMDAPQK